MTINKTSGASAINPTPAARAQRPAAAPAASQAAPKGPSLDRFKAQGGQDDDKALADFIAANKKEFPEIESAALNLKDNMTAAAALFVLSGAVGFGAHEVIRRLTDKKNAFVEAKAMSTDPVERKLIASSYDLHVGTAMKLAADPDVSVRYALAARMKANPHEFDKAVLEIMAKDDLPLIRGMVASSDKLSAKTVAALANTSTETSPQVRAAALGNKNLPKDQKEFLTRLDEQKGGVFATMNRILTKADSEDNNKLKLGFLRQNPQIGLTRQMMEGLAASESPAVREALARRADAPDDLIKQMYEHRSFTFFQKIQKMLPFLGDPGLPKGKANYETDRIVLMSLANNPNAHAGMLTEMVEKVNKPTEGNNFKSKVDPALDRQLGIPVTDVDPNQYNTDIVARAIVGNPRTDDTMRALANAKATPFRINEKTSLEAFLAFNKANGLYMSQKYEEAATEYKKAIGTTFHDSEQAYYELAQCYMGMQDVRSARSALIQALNIHNGYGAAAEMLDAIDHQQGGR